MEPTSHTVEDIIGGSDSDLTELSDEEPPLVASGNEAPPSSPVANVPPPRGRDEPYARRVNRNRIQSDDEVEEDPHEGSGSEGEVTAPRKTRRGSPRDRTDPRKKTKRRSPAPGLVPGAEGDVLPRIKISRDANGDAVSATKTDDGKPSPAAGAGAGGKRRVTLKLKTGGDRGTPDHDQGRDHSDTGAHESSGKRKRPPPPPPPSARQASGEREQERGASPGDTGGGKRRERRADSQELVRRTDRERDRGDRDRPLKKPKRDRPADEHDTPTTSTGEPKRLKKIVRYDVDPRHTPGVEEFFGNSVKDSVGAGERGGKTPKREEGRVKRDAGDPDGEKPRGKRDVDLDGEREGKRGTGERRRRDGDESEREEVHVSSHELAPPQQKKKRQRVPAGAKVEDASSDVEITAVSVKKKSSAVKRDDGKREEGKREDLDPPSTTDPASRPKLKRPGGERPANRMAAISASGTRTPNDQGKPRTPHGADGSARRPGGGVQKKVQYDPLATALSGVMGGPSSGVSSVQGFGGRLLTQMCWVEFYAD